MSDLWLYKTLSRWPGLSFRAKVMLVAFVGTHIPLLALLGYFLVAYQADLGVALVVLGVALASTLVGTGVTLAILSQLLRPVGRTAEAFRTYLDQRRLPQLPTGYGDEVGRLMADTVHTLRRLDGVIEELTYYDPDTGLPNRDAALARVDEAIADLTGNQRLAVVVVRLADAVAIKSSRGSPVQAGLVRQVADRWQRQPGEWVTVARLREDALLGVMRVPEAAAPHLGGHLRELLDALGESLELDGQPIRPRVAGGVAVAPEDADRAGLLLERAETALNEMERSEEGQDLGFFTADLPSRVADRLSLASDLRRALEQRSLALHLQPMVDQGGRAFGAEGLIRWHHSERGWVSPGEFVPVAEEQGLVSELTQGVLEAAAGHLRRWQAEASHPGLTLSVNLSARDLHDRDLPERLNNLLKEQGVEPESLQIEVTETAALTRPERSLEVLSRLSAMGLGVALDDFGTGYSSLAYLRQLPWNKLKIDRTFVQGVDTDPDNHTLCQSMVSLATAFGREVIAEGVETEAERRTLSELGCRQFQGFLFAPALPAEEFARWRGDQVGA